MHRTVWHMVCLLTAMLATGFVFGRAQAQDGGLDLVTLTHQGVERSYYIHLPAALQGRTGNPAVLVFHGGEGDGLRAEAASGFSAAADAGGFVAIFPNSPGQQWNDGRAETRSDFDDVDFVRAVIADAATRDGVDQARVFAAGISNGGMFTQRLACDATDAFRAFGVLAANMPADLAPVCAPDSPAPMIFFNGTDDRLMPFDGGEIRSLRALGIGVGGTVLGHAATQDFWAEANGCTTRGGPRALPDGTADGTTVSVDTISGCRGGAELDFFTIAGGGHNWPGMDGRGGRFAGTISQDIDATHEIVTFFDRHGL